MSFGSISSLSPNTRWDPEALDAALAQADRVMFPQSVEIGAGLFSIIGAVAKWHGQGTLPAGQTLQPITTPEQWARLVALRDRGILKPGFERTHPYHLAMSLAGSLRDRRRSSLTVAGYVHRYVDRHKDKLVHNKAIGRRGELVQPTFSSLNECLELGGGQAARECRLVGPLCRFRS